MDPQWKTVDIKDNFQKFLKDHVSNEMSDIKNKLEVLKNMGLIKDIPELNEKIAEIEKLSKRQ